MSKVKSDHYAVLDVAPDAPAETIRAAYFKLAKELHPDRQVTEDPEATERFLRVQNAYEILIDTERRDEYDRERADAVARGVDEEGLKERLTPRRMTGPSDEDLRDARLAYEKAVNLHDAGQDARALRAMKAVVRVVPDQPDYRSLLGYLMGREGERLHAARDHCRHAVEAEPYDPDFRARLGYVYMRAGLWSVAEKCFDEAIALDPQNELAIACRRKVSEPQKSGLFGSLKRLLGS